MKNQNLKKPFFANFLENQLTQDESNTVQGGITNPKFDSDNTLKYPSDSDEDVTMKAPSDNDEDTTLPLNDGYHTMKYPSDNDEAGFEK